MSFFLAKRAFSTKPEATGVKGIVNSILHGSPAAAQAYSDSYTNYLFRGKSVHEMSIHNVKPEAMEDYKALIKSAHTKISADPSIPARLFGSFTTEPLVHIWEYSNYGAIDQTVEAIAGHDEYKRFQALLKPMLRSRNNQIILEFAFWNASIPYDANAIYELRSYHLKPGRMLQWEQAWQKGIEARKQFVEPVGAWFSQLGDLNFVHHMWAYPYDTPASPF
ncbi:hypothetical protein HDU91_007318 [Kappamyces sp. JEL0680]|nr:hypothetical protein HDU91_007318 [Kappamyces sp. JEL0680]